MEQRTNEDKDFIDDHYNKLRPKEQSNEVVVFYKLNN